MADLTITAANVVASSDSLIEHSTSGESITAGKAIYKNPDTKKWMLADNDSATADLRRAGGIALNGASDGQPIAVLKGGDVAIGATLTPGSAYYLSSTPGGICPVADLGAGDYVCQIGLAKSSTVLHVDIQYPGVSL